LTKIGVAHPNKTSTLEITSGSFLWKQTLHVLQSHAPLKSLP